MKKGFSKYLKVNMVRPILCKAAAMMAIAVLLAVLWNRFVNVQGYFATHSHVFSVFGAIFLIAAWFCFLRLDGFGSKFASRRKKRNRPATSMADIVQTDLDHDEDLTPGESAFCSLAASLLSSVVCWLIAVI